MSWVAVGVAGGTIVSGMLTSQQQAAAQRAANRANARIAQGQLAAGIAGANEQGRQFNILQKGLFDRRQAAGEILDPISQRGELASSEQAALLGLLGPEAQEAAYGTLQQSPGQRFLRERQERALLRNSAAIGGLGGGNVRTALQQQAAGFAQEDINQRLAMLGALGSQGQAAGLTLSQMEQGADLAPGAGKQAIPNIMGRKNRGRGSSIWDLNDKLDPIGARMPGQKALTKKVFGGLF